MAPTSTKESVMHEYSMLSLQEADMFLEVAVEILGGPQRHDVLEDGIYKLRGDRRPTRSR